MLRRLAALCAVTGLLIFGGASTASAAEPLPGQPGNGKVTAGKPSPSSQLYLHGSWATVAEGSKVSGPPCQGKRSRATLRNCDTTSASYGYRTSVVIAIVEGGDHETGSKNSGAKYFRCL